jgi:hypothetical protein
MTFTPRSTELPLVPTPILIGSPEQPLKLAILAENDTANRRAAGAVEDELNEQLAFFRLGFYDGLSIEVELVDSRQDLLYRLCNSTDTLVIADAFTFYAAELQCGAQPYLQSEIAGRTGSNFDLVVFRQRIFNLGNLDGRALCARSADDLTSFIHPAMALQAAGVDPFTELSEIVTGFESDAEMVVAVSGVYEPGGRPRCDAAAIPSGSFDELRDDLQNEDNEQALTERQVDNLLALLEPEWRQLPYNLVMAPPDRLMTPYLREEVLAALVTLDQEAGRPKTELQSLIGFEAFREVDSSSYATFRAWMADTGWNMASLAQP